MENLIERGVILADPGQAVDAAHLFPDSASTPANAPAHTLQASGRLGEARPGACDTALIERLLSGKLDLQGLETHLIEAAVERSHGNLAAAARLLGLTRPQLSYRLNKLRNL